MRNIIRFIFVLSVIGFAAEGICAAQLKEVSGVVSDKLDKRPLMGVIVYAFNTVPEAQDAMDEIKRIKEAGAGVIYFEGTNSVNTNSEGYYIISVAPTGAFVFFTEMSDPVMEKIDGRLEINVSMLVGEVLDDAIITAMGGEEPVIDIPEFDGETIGGGVKLPIAARLGKDNARLIFQTYMVDMTSKDTVLYRKPKVMDGAEYHKTQFRRMGYDPEYDPLYLLAEGDMPLTDSTRSISWRDTVPIPDINHTYFYNCRMWMEDYNMVYYSMRDTTIFRSDRVRQPMKFLDYVTSVYSLDPNDYKKQARRERRNTAGQINLKFPVGKDMVDPDDSESMAELNKLRQELLEISRSMSTTIKEFHIEGTASPEGNYETNVSLASRRMNSIKREVMSVLPPRTLERIYAPTSSRVAEWIEVADILEADSLTKEADEVRAIVARNPGRDSQMAELRRLPYYQSVIVPVLPKLRTVKYTSIVEVFRELTPEEILEKYEEDKNFDFALYEYWHLFNMVKDEDELIELYKRAMETSSHTTTPWILPANNLAEAYIKRGITDTSLLAPFLDLRSKVNYTIRKDGVVVAQINQEELVANQIIMLLNSSKFKRAAQYATLLPDEKYHDLILFTRCLSGFWKRDTGLREEIIGTSPQNAVVMYLASDKVHQALDAASKLDMRKPVSHYLNAQALCRSYRNFYDMRSDYDEETFLDKSDIAAEYLVNSFRMDPSFIDIARADYDIYEQLFDKAMEMYEKQNAVTQ